MRRPDTIEHLYIDFDGFFASVEQQARPGLRGKPVGIVPFEGAANTCVIAASREAKRSGVRGVMTVAEARRICPGLILVPQSPDLYRRAHNALLAEIGAVIPVDAVKSVDELACRLDAGQRRDPEALSAGIKDRIARHVGPHITCSIGFAQNRQLAKIAGKQNKPDGMTIWNPSVIPGVLYPLPFSDIPGIGRRMETRLHRAGIAGMEQLLSLAPGHMRKIWRNVTGERLWYALHGYDVQAGTSQRAAFGHGRVLPPQLRSMDKAEPVARMLLIKAARRMRNAGYRAGRLQVRCASFRQRFAGRQELPAVCDDKACLSALKTVWSRLRPAVPERTPIVRLSVTLGDLSKAGVRQLDLLCGEDAERRERVTGAVDALNRRYGKTVVSYGFWEPPPGGHLGGKISYTRIPDAEDFW